jgi:hypothetical protein
VLDADDPVPQDPADPFGFRSYSRGQSGSYSCSVTVELSCGGSSTHADWMSSSE